jgi:flagellar export protein FliJ
MDKTEHLEKLKMLVEKHEKKLMGHCARHRKKLDEELKKLNLLSSYLEEYRTNLQNNNSSIYAYKYQQYQVFFEKLEKAIHQQVEVVTKAKDLHLRMLKEIEFVKKKLENLNKLIDKQKKLIQFHQDKRENQEANDLFNQIKRMK